MEWSERNQIKTCVIITRAGVSSCALPCAIQTRFLTILQFGFELLPDYSRLFRILPSWSAAIISLSFTLLSFLFKFVRFFMILSDLQDSLLLSVFFLVKKCLLLKLLMILEFLLFEFLWFLHWNENTHQTRSGIVWLNWSV